MTEAMTSPSASARLTSKAQASCVETERIRAIFVDTWNDFYTWSPPIGSALHPSHTAQPDDPDEDPALAFFHHLDALPVDHASTKPNTARLPKHKIIGKLGTRRVTLDTDNYLASATEKKLIPRYASARCRRHI